MEQRLHQDYPALVVRHGPLRIDPNVLRTRRYSLAAENFLTANALATILPIS